MRGPVEPPTLRPLDGVTGLRLRRLHSLFVTHWAQWFRGRELPVTPVQGGILLLIESNARISQIALARLLRVEAPTLMQALNPLVAADLVLRERSRRDRRALELRLSKKGLAAASILRCEVHRHEADLLSGLTQSEQALLYTLLEKAVKSAETASSLPDS